MTLTHCTFCPWLLIMHVFVQSPYLFQYFMINRTGVAGNVLHTALLLDYLQNNKLFDVLPPKSLKPDKDK